MIARVVVPHLDRFVVSVGPSHQDLVAQVDGISADERAVDGLDGSCLSDIPNLNVIIPTSRDDEVGVILIKLDAEDSV